MSEIWFKILKAKPSAKRCEEERQKCNMPTTVKSWVVEFQIPPPPVLGKFQGFTKEKYF